MFAFIVEVLIWLIIFVATIGLIRIYFSMKTPKWLTLQFIIKVLEGLWIAIVIVLAVMNIIFSLPAAINP